MDEFELRIAKRHARKIIMAMYADEPCRICGQILTLQDIKDGAVFAGYSKDNKARAAHMRCWDEFKERKRVWAYPVDAEAA